MTPMNPRQQDFLQMLRKLLDWRHRQQGIPLESMTLASLVPCVDLQDTAAAALAAEQTVALAADFVAWLRTECQLGVATQKQAVWTLLVLAKYQYRQATQQATADGDYDVPTVTALRTLHKQVGDVHQRVTTRRAKPAYAVRAEVLPSALQQALTRFYDFLTDVSWAGRQDRPMRDVTAQLRLGTIYRLFGWLQQRQGVPLEALSLESLIPFEPLGHKLVSKQVAKQTMQLLSEYTRWLRKERGCHPDTERMTIDTLINVAKYLYHDETDYPDIKQYQDVPVITMLREERSRTKERGVRTPAASQLDRKWLSFELYLQCIQQLKGETAPKTINGDIRSQGAVAKSVQRYLLFALLGYMPPDRQRTLRELKVGTTLVRGWLHTNGAFAPQAEGDWYIHLQAADYKTGDTYGEQWQLVPKILYAALETWLYHGYQDAAGQWHGWRQVFHPDHDFVFTQPNGKPMHSSSLTSLFKRAAYRISGKLLNPHLVRSIAITYFLEQGASDAEMESLATGMKHSRKAQRDSYDQRQPFTKVKAAQTMMLKAAGLDSTQA